jgi:hypothetical protein
MEINTLLTEEERKINLAGFPPIYKISSDLKKKREFNKSIETINKNVLNNLNILNVKNILGIKKT